MQSTCDTMPPRRAIDLLIGAPLALVHVYLSVAPPQGQLALRRAVPSFGRTFNLGGCQRRAAGIAAAKASRRQSHERSRAVWCHDVSVSGHAPDEH